MFLAFLLKTLIIIIFILISVAFFTLLERKLLASLQRRRGPNIIGWFGLLQAIADGLKLLLKETIIPHSGNHLIFIFAPIITFIVSLICWAIIPFNIGGVLSNINLGVLLFFGVSTFGVYSLIMSGWSSNSKYAFLGGMRSAAQMVSYEVAFGFTLISIFLLTGSFNLTSIVISQQKVWFVIPLFPIFLIFFISTLAETNRHPFDLPEAEAELVAGYNTEYSAMTFALFFLGEYSNMIMINAFIVLLFFGGWFLFKISHSFFFAVKVVIFCSIFILIRGLLPRYRYDQLMSIGWKVFVPLTLGWLFFITALLISFDSLPKLNYIL